MKVYTKGGDKGTTSLVGGARVAKDDLRVEAYGTVDELMAQIAFLHDNLLTYNTLPEQKTQLEQVLNTLMTIAALLATDDDSSSKVSSVKSEDIAELELWIDAISAQLSVIKHFTLPCGHILVSLTHICRTVCRRAERRIVQSSRQHSVDENITAYINRLSDYLYVLGRKLTSEFSIKETLWRAKR